MKNAKGWEEAHTAFFRDATAWVGFYKNLLIVVAITWIHTCSRSRNQESILDLIFRTARKTDLVDLVNMLADDELGRQREDPGTPLNQSYLTAFSHINADSNNELVVAESAGAVVGMLQLTFIPYLTHKGSTRCLIEGVRIHETYRGKGLGTAFFQWAIERARQRGCSLVQLTTDRQRPDAARFYESLGFRATHTGFKLRLDSDDA